MCVSGGLSRKSTSCGGSCEPDNPSGRAWRRIDAPGEPSVTVLISEAVKRVLARSMAAGRFKELLVSDDSIVLCVYFIVLGVVVIVGMGGISCVSKEEKAIDDAVAKISEAIEKLESKLRAQDLEIERLKKARRGRE